MKSQTYPHKHFRRLAMNLFVVGTALTASGKLPAAVVNYQNLTIGPNGALIGGLGDVFNIRGNLINNSTLNTIWDTHLSQIDFNSSGGHQLAWTGTEQRRGNAGFINNFAVGAFVLPSGASLTTSGGGALYTRVLVLGDGVSQLNSITGSPLNIHYNPGSPQNAYLNFQTYTLPTGSVLSPAAAPADFNVVWNGTAGNWTDASRWSGGVVPLNTLNSVTLYDATINSGTVTLDQSIGYIQKLNLGSGGTLTGPNSATAWDAFTWGTMANNNPSTISGGATVNANGDISIVGDSPRNLDNATINNHAGYSATWAAGNSDINVSNNAAINNNGSFVVQNNRSLGRNGGTGAFNNVGTFTKNSGTGTTSIGSANFTFNNTGSINVQTGTLEFDGPLVGPTTASISVAGPATLVIADKTTTFAGNIANAGPLNVGDAAGATSSAVLRLQVNNQINNSSVLTVKGDGLLDINSFSESIGAVVVTSGNISIGTGTMLPSSLTMTGGTITGTGSGTLQLASGVTAVSDSGGNPTSITSHVDLGGVVRTFTVNHGSGSVDMVISGAVSNGGLTKTGAGTLTLVGANTYNGGTTLSQGGLNINNSNAIGAGPFTINNGTTIDNTTAGLITLATNNTQLWAGSFTFIGTQSLNFGTGAVTLNANPTVTVSANTLTVSPIGNGTGNSLTKTGAGTLFITGGASYTGTTSVNAGSMTISAGPFAGSASTVTAAATMTFINGANAGGGTFTNSSTVSASAIGGSIQFADQNTTAGTATYNNNGGTGVIQNGGSGGNGATIVFNSGASAGNAVIANLGASSRYAVSSATVQFNSGSTAGNATITNSAGADPIVGGPAPGGITLFSGNATGGASTLISNAAGPIGGVSGLVEFKDTADAGTANITINSSAYSRTTNKWINSASAAGAMITINGSIAEFEDTATAGSDRAHPASITTNAGALTQLQNTSTAAFANITNMQAIGGQGLAYTRFYHTADAGNATITNKGSAIGYYGGYTEFHNSSSAAAAFINNDGGVANGGFGGETDFYDNANAGSATFVEGGANTGGNGGVAQFFNSSKAGTATFTNNPATAANAGNNGGGYVYFNNGTSADHATITNNGSAVNSSAQTNGGHAVFFGGSTADHAAIINNGALNSTSQPGETDITGGAITGSATFTNNASAVSGAPGGKTVLSGSTGNPASAGSTTFISNGGTVSGALGGVANLYIGSTGGTATFIANGGNGAGSLGGTTLINAGDAANSTLIANGGTNGGAGGITQFKNGPGLPTGGAARVITNSGGIFDMSGIVSSLTVGSIEGDGRFQLGSTSLTSGSLNTDTTVSGLIVNGGISGGSNASLAKVGSGKLSLTNANTYTGVTTIAGGILSTNLLFNGGLASGIGASSNAASNLVLNGGTFQYTGPAVSSNRLYTLGAAGGGLDASGTGPLNFNTSAAMSYTGSGPRTFSLSGTNTDANTFAQTIADGTGGATSLAKSGPGTWLLSNLNSYTGPTTITGGRLGYSGSDPAPQTAAQAYTLSPANPAGNQTGFSLGLDFNVNAGRASTVTQLGVFDNGRDGFANAHTAYIYNRDTQGVLASIPFSPGTTGALSADGYRFLSLSSPLTLSGGSYTVVTDYSGTDLEVNAGLNGGHTQGTTLDGGGAISFVGVGRYGSPGNYPTSAGGTVPYTFGAGSFVFNSLPAGRIPGDATINGATAVLDLGANQNGNVATVTLDGGGSIVGTGTSQLTSRSSFQMKSGTVTAILAGSGVPLMKTTTGTVTLSGANTYSGNDTISAGTLKFNIASGTPIIASGVTATVAAGATLELAGSISALGAAGGNRVHVVNDSHGGAGQPAGLVVTGTNQIVGSIDGSGSTSVAALGSLTADHIIQSALFVGGNTGNPATVTIEAADSGGNPLGKVQSQPDGMPLAALFSQAEPILAGIGGANLNSATSDEELGGGPMGNEIAGPNSLAVPEPSTIAMGMAFAIIFLVRQLAGRVGNRS